MNQWIDNEWMDGWMDRWIDVSGELAQATEPYQCVAPDCV